MRSGPVNVARLAVRRSLIFDGNVEFRTPLKLEVPGAANLEALGKKQAWSDNLRVDPASVA